MNNEVGASERNRGAVELALCMVQEGLDRSTAADRVGISGNYMSLLTSSKAKPGRKVALAIHAQFGIEVAAWDQPYIPPTPTSAVATEPEGANP